MAEEPTTGPPEDIIVVDTLIVGAGLSGAYAFDQLCHHFSSSSFSSSGSPQNGGSSDGESGRGKEKKSYRIALVEARERAGGRSCTIYKRVKHVNEKKDDHDHESSNDNCYSVDVGGQWLGKTHREMLSLCQAFGLELQEQSFPPSVPVVSSIGNDDSSENNATSSVSLMEMAYYPLKPLSDAALEEIKSFETFLHDSYLQLESLRENQNQTDNNHRKILEQEWDVVSFHNMVEQKCALPESKEQFSFFCQTCLAVDPRHCSFLFFLYYVFVWSGGGVHGMELLGDGPDSFQALKVKGGTQQISIQLIQRASETASSSGAAVDARVYYGCEIGSICHEHKEEDADDDFVIVTSAAGDKVFHCCNVILALSPTLFYKSMTFTPPLSNERISLYESLVMGRAVKVIVAFEKDFWKDATTKGNSSTAVLLSISEVGIVSNIFESNIGPYPALVGLLTGDRATQYYSTASKQDRQELVLSQLRIMYPNYRDPPVAFIEKDWLSEPHSGGCFAAIASASEASVFATYKHLLHEAIIKDKVFIAGTESSTQFYGYLEGAALAGKRAAAEVIALDALG